MATEQMLPLVQKALECLVVKILVSYPTVAVLSVPPREMKHRLIIQMLKCSIINQLDMYKYFALSY